MHRRAVPAGALGWTTYGVDSTRFTGSVACASRVTTVPVFGVGASRDDELWFVPGFVEVAAGGDVLAAALEASHLLPPDRLDALARRAAQAIGAENVSMWLIDYGHAWLMPEIDPGRPKQAEQAETLAVATTAAGRVFARAAPMESDEPHPHRWVPLLDGTERLGVLRFDFPQPLSEAQRHACDVIASLVGELLVSKRAHTDLYDIQRRRGGMSLAAEMQWQQLPPLQSSTPAVVVAGFLEPAYSVGGDGFDYSINGDELDITIYDAVGHGLRSALLSALTIASLRHARRRGLGLSERLSAADQALESVFPGDFVTAQLAAVSVTTGEVEWVNAGHPPPMLIRRGEVVGELHCPPRPPLGLHSLQTTTTVVASVPLEPGDRVLFYTDGLIEGGRRGQGAIRRRPSRGSASAGVTRWSRMCRNGAPPRLRSDRPRRPRADRRCNDGAGRMAGDTGHAAGPAVTPRPHVHRRSARS